jgi:NAD(P)H dehydrogenase (quinone)
MTHVAIVYHSGYGHTAVLAEAAAEGARKAGAEASLHKIEGLTQNFDAMLDALDAADAIIFGAPTYMGDVSAPMKAFMDASSKKWFVGAWKDKVGAAFTNSASFSGDKLNSIVSLAVFGAQQQMIWVGMPHMKAQFNGNETSAPTEYNRIGSWLGGMAQSDNAGPDVTPPSGDKLSMSMLGERVATITAKLKA